MGISNLFKRFKTNAASYEEAAEPHGLQEGGDGESQAARAEREGHHAPEPERANGADDS